MKRFFEHIKTIWQRLRQMKHRRRVEAALMLLCTFSLMFFVIGIFPNFFATAEDIPANYVQITAATNTDDAADENVFGEPEEDTSATPEIQYRINNEIKNIEVASGDSKKDEDAEVNRDYGTNSSRLSPADAPVLSRLGGSVLPSSAVSRSAVTDLIYADKSEVSGFSVVENTLFYFDENRRPVTGHQTINKVKYYFNSYGAKASMVGIDVSNHNGQINWSRVKAAGVDFAIIRVGFRGYGTSGKLRLDSRFHENMKGAISAGIDVGVYFYSQAITVAEALEEASVAVNYARAYKVTYPIYFDTEFATGDRNGRADGLSVRARTDIAVAFCEAVKNAGFKAGVYASKTFFTDHLNFSRLSRYQIWNAHYTSETTDFKYKYQVWQYTDKGTVDGIPNKTDINISLYDYKNNSDMQQNGAKIVFFNSAAELAAVKKAENTIQLYSVFKLESAYNNALNQIQSLSDARVQAQLTEVLEKYKRENGFVTTPAVTEAPVETSGSTEKSTP